MDITQKNKSYPINEPYNSGMLTVSNLHSIYFEEYGKPNGKPVVVLHGGPGSASKPKQSQPFNPEKFRIILFDQRGCGKSTPNGEVKENNTQNLISDIEELRKHLKIEKWSVTGGSWGSTLALLYAQAHPSSVISMALRAIFLAEEQGVQWLNGHNGASNFFPEEFAKFRDFIPQSEQSDLVSAYYKKLTTGSIENQQAAALNSLEWAGLLCSGLEFKRIEDAKLQKDTEANLAADELTELKAKQTQEKAEFPAIALTMTRIQWHYDINKSFIEEGQIIADAHKIADIPITLVHGRYDMCCPTEGAYRLHKALPKSKLVIVPDAGHSSEELAPAFSEAIERL